MRPIPNLLPAPASRGPWAAAAGVALAILGGGLAAAEEAAQPRVWQGPDGHPLPFADEDEVVAFLATAGIVSATPIGRGINGFLRLLMERDGVRARAVFRDVEVQERNKRVEGFWFRLFRDSGIYECAAYRLSRRIGLDRVPPAVPRYYGGRPGSVQLWIEDARDVGEGFQPRKPVAWVRGLWEMSLFDNLIQNIDRNAGNFIEGPDSSLWLIDHTRAFQTSHEMVALDDVTRVNRRIWEQILSLAAEGLRHELGDYLNRGEIPALLVRRDRLREHIDALVQSRGEDAVFY